MDRPLVGLAFFGTHLESPAGDPDHVIRVHRHRGGHHVAEGAGRIEFGGRVLVDLFEDDIGTERHPADHHDQGDHELARG